MDYRLTFAFLAIVACYLGVVLCEEGKACNPQDLRESSCGANETCHLDGPTGGSDGFLRGRCRCRKDFSRASRALDAPCVPRKPSTPPASPAAGSDDDVGGGGGGGGGGGPAAARRSDDTSGDADDPGPAAGGGETPTQGSGVSTGAVTAAVLVPLIVAVGALLVIGARRYRWTERVRRLRGSRYEEVRIGQEEDDDDDDDPPLA